MSELAVAATEKLAATVADLLKPLEGAQPSGALCIVHRPAEGETEPERWAVAAWDSSGCYPCWLAEDGHALGFEPTHYAELGKVVPTAGRA